LCTRKWCFFKPEAGQVSFALPGTLQGHPWRAHPRRPASKSPLQDKQHLTTFLPASRFSLGVKSKIKSLNPNAFSYLLICSFAFALIPIVRNMIRPGGLDALVGLAGVFRGTTPRISVPGMALKRPPKG